jgi:pyruvate dehydrogenase E2 component (dihydrolipoamide acetyltransferase)
MTAVATARRPASPYARRLARERGFALELITGTGPGGRIVAADVEAFAARRVSLPAAAAATAAAVAAYGTSVSLAAVRSLLAGLAESRAEVSLDDLLVRAAAQALATAMARPGPGQAPRTVALERSGTGAPLAVVADPHLGLVSQLHLRLAEAAVPAEVPELTLRRLAETGVRPLSMPVIGGAAARLVVSAGEASPLADVLLAFDAGRLDEDAAATLLARLRDALEHPLGLLA